MFRKRISERRPSHAIPSTRTTEHTSVPVHPVRQSVLATQTSSFSATSQPMTSSSIPRTPEHPSVPRSLQHAKRNAIGANAVNPSITSGRFCRRIQPERPSSGNISPGQQTQRHATPAENHPEVRNHGKFGGHFLRNRPEVAGGRPQAMSRQAPRPARYR